MTKLSAEALRELKALAEKAAPGPWEWEGRTVDDDGYVRIPECSYLVGCICLADTYEGYQKDCDYIAAASPDVILALLAERERLLGALAGATESLNTLATLSGKDEYMKDMVEVRSYARSRHQVASAAIAAAGEE